MQEDQVIKNQEFIEISFKDHSFSQCRFENCRFSRCEFHGARFVECTFSHCSLEHPSSEGTRWQDVLFEESKVVGVEFHRCDPTFFSLGFKKSVLLACNFSDLKMKRTCFQESKVKECYFNNTQLIESDFTHTDLEGTLFHHTDLSKANFTHAINYSIDPQTNLLKKAIFSAPEVLSLLKFFDLKITYLT